MTALTDFADLAASATHDGLGEPLIEAARRRIFDGLCSVAVGLTTPDGLRSRELVRVAGDREPSLADQIKLYVAAARCTETDDISIECCVTTGSVIAPVATAVAARLGANDRDLLTATAVGYEAMIRLGIAFDGANVLGQGVWPTYLTAPFGAAAIAAKLMALDAEATARALAVALTRTPRWLGRNFAGATPRWTLCGAAAAEGVAAAQAAAVGIGADFDILPAFGEAMGVSIRDSVLSRPDGFGRRILDVDCKTFPTSRQGMSAIQAFIKLMPFDRPLEEIERVEVSVPAAYRAMVSRQVTEQGRLDSMVSVAHQMALAALDPERLFDCGRETLRLDAAVTQFSAKVSVQDDSQMTAVYPARWGGRVRIQWRSGETQEMSVEAPDGSAQKPFDWPELLSKATRLAAARRLDESLVARLMDRCRGLGRQPQGSTAVHLLNDLEQLCRSRDSSVA